MHGKRERVASDILSSLKKVPQHPYGEENAREGHHKTDGRETRFCNCILMDR